MRICLSFVFLYLVLLPAPAQTPPATPDPARLAKDAKRKEAMAPPAQKGAAMAASPASATGPNTETGEANRLRWLHMKFAFHDYNGGKTFTRCSEEWYSSPGRTKSVSTAPEHEVMQIRTGDLRAHYQRHGKVGLAVLRPASGTDHEIAARAFERLRFITPASEQAALSAYSSRYNLLNARITGHKTIAGRNAVVAEGQFAAGDDHRRMVMYVDRETGLELGDKIYQGEELLRTCEATVFEVNQPIPDSLFKAEFPAGTRVFKGPIGEQRLFDGLQRRLKDPSALEKELAISPSCDLGFPVALGAIYRPSYVPPGYKLLCTGAGYDPGPVSTWKTDFVNPATGDTIVLEQRAVASRADGWPQLRGGMAGQCMTNEAPYPYSVLRWPAPGAEPVEFTLSASALAEDEMIKIAQSLTPSESAAGWLGKWHSWRLAAKVLGNPDADTLRQTAGVIRKRVECLFGPGAKAETEGAGGIVVSAASNNPGMRALLVAAATMPGHIRLVGLAKGTKIDLGPTADAETVTAPDGSAMPEAQILKLAGTVLDEHDLAYKRYPFADGGYWGKVEIVPSSREKALRYAESRPGCALAVILDDSMVLGYVPPQFIAHDFPQEVTVASQSQRGRLFKAILESGPLPARVEAQPAEAKGAE